MRNRLKPDNGDFNNAQYTSIRLDDIRTDWRVSVANIRVVARRDPGARRLRALVDSIWDGIVADAGKYGTGFDGPAFSRDVEEMLSGTGYIYTTRNFDVFRLADVIEIRDARLDDVSGRDCVRFVVVADAHDEPFASAEILQWLGDEGGSCPRNCNFDLRRQEIACVADELEAYAHDVEATVLRKLDAVVEQLKTPSTRKAPAREHAFG